MNDQMCCHKAMIRFRLYLTEEEKSTATITKYMHDIEVFSRFLGKDQLITKEKVLAYKHYLGDHYKVTSANSMLAALNKFLDWMGLGDCRVRSFKYQRQLFCEKSRELSKEEYGRLLKTARSMGNTRLEMMLQTICGTGIRVGELPYITVEAVKRGEAVVLGKGKRRVIFITAQLRRYLLDYCRRGHIKTGSVFVTRGGQAMNRSNIWTEMKRLGRAAGVESFKVFPHNLRHLFARICYQKKKDIAYLADILGHSNIETTRVYTISSGSEHKKMLASLGLVI